MGTRALDELRDGVTASLAGTCRGVEGNDGMHTLGGTTVGTRGSVTPLATAPLAVIVEARHVALDAVRKRSFVKPAPLRSAVDP